MVTALSVFVLTGSGVWTFSVLIKPMTKDLEWSNAQLIGVYTLAGILSALVSPVLGRVIDRYGTRVVIPAFLLLFGVALLLTSYIQTLWQFYLLYGIGLGVSRSAVVQVGAPAVAANWFIRKRGVAFATIPAAVGIGGVLFVQFAQGIVDWFDWRMVWRILGLFIVAVPVPLAWLVIRSRPEAIGLLPDGDEEPRLPRPGSKSQAGASTIGTAMEIGWTLKETIKTRAFWTLNVAFLLISFPASSIIIVLHPYLTDIGISTSTAAQLLSFYAAAVIIGSVVWGMLVQILSTRILLVPFAVFYGLCIALLVIIGSSSVILLYLVFLALGIAITGTFQVGTQIFADYYGRKEIGSIIGVHSLVRALSGALAPLVLALIRDATDSYTFGFKIYAVMCLVAGALLFFATPPKKSQDAGASSSGELGPEKSAAQQGS